MKRLVGEEPDCAICPNPDKWPLPGNRYAAYVFSKLCTKLNLDFGLGTHVAGLLEIRDPEVIRKVNVLWSVYSEREKRRDAGN